MGDPEERGQPEAAGVAVRAGCRALRRGDRPGSVERQLHPHLAERRVLQHGLLCAGAEGHRAHQPARPGQPLVSQRQRGPGHPGQHLPVERRRVRKRCARAPGRSGADDAAAGARRRSRRGRGGLQAHGLRRPAGRRRRLLHRPQRLVAAHARGRHEQGRQRAVRRRLHRQLRRPDQRHPGRPARHVAGHGPLRRQREHPGQREQHGHHHHQRADHHQQRPEARPAQDAHHQGGDRSGQRRRQDPAERQRQGSRQKRHQPHGAVQLQQRALRHHRAAGDHPGQRLGQRLLQRVQHRAGQRQHQATALRADPQGQVLRHRLRRRHPAAHLRRVHPVRVGPHGRGRQAGQHRLPGPVQHQHPRRGPVYTAALQDRL